MRNGSQVLWEAAQYAGSGWTQGATARDSVGRVCSILSSKACQWSVYGAVVKATSARRGMAVGDRELQASPFWKMVCLRAWMVLPDDLRAITRAQHAIDVLNDLSGQTQVQIVKLLREWSHDPEIVKIERIV